FTPSGCARCTSAPDSSSTSTAQYQPYVASMTTRGFFPARSITARSAAGLLGVGAGSGLRPSSVIRTITLRRRCRSIPTTCRPSYASVIVGLLCLVETDALHLPASARSGGPLLHRITGLSVTNTPTRGGG